MNFRLPKPLGDLGIGREFHKGSIIELTVELLAPGPLRACMNFRLPKLLGDPGIGRRAQRSSIIELTVELLAPGPLRALYFGHNPDN